MDTRAHKIDESLEKDTLLEDHGDPNSTQSITNPQPLTTNPPPPSDHPPALTENYSSPNVKASLERYCKELSNSLGELLSHPELSLLEKNYKSEILSIKSFIQDWILKFQSCLNMLSEMPLNTNPSLLINDIEVFVSAEYKTLYIQFKNVQTFLKTSLEEMKNQAIQTPKPRSLSASAGATLQFFIKKSDSNQQALSQLLNTLTTEFGRVNTLINTAFGNKNFRFIRTDYAIPSISLNYHPFMQQLKNQNQSEGMINNPNTEILNSLATFTQYLDSGEKIDSSIMQAIFKAYLTWLAKPIQKHAESLKKLALSLEKKPSLTSKDQSAPEHSLNPLNLEMLTNKINYHLYVYLTTPIAYLEATQINPSLKLFSETHFNNKTTPISLWHEFLYLLKAIKPLLRQAEFDEVSKRLDDIKPESWLVSAKIVLGNKLEAYTPFSSSISLSPQTDSSSPNSNPAPMSFPWHTRLYYLHAIVAHALYPTTSVDLLYTKIITGDKLNLCVDHAFSALLSYREIELLSPHLKHIEFHILSAMRSDQPESEKTKTLFDAIQKQIIEMKTLSIKNIHAFLGYFEKIFPSILSSQMQKSSIPLEIPHYFIDPDLSNEQAKRKLITHRIMLIEDKIKHYIDSNQNLTLASTQNSGVNQLKTNGILSAQKILSEINVLKIQCSSQNELSLDAWIAMTETIFSKTTTLSNPFSDRAISCNIEKDLKSILKEIRSYYSNLKIGKFELPEPSKTNRSRSGSAPSLSNSSNSLLGSTKSSTTLNSVPEILTNDSNSGSEPCNSSLKS